jgi:hypothetical protein
MAAGWTAHDAQPCCAEAPPRADCCVALGAELSSSARRCGVEEGTDWRLWLVRSTLLRSDNAWLAVRAPRGRPRRGAACCAPQLRAPPLRAAQLQPPAPRAACGS